MKYISFNDYMDYSQNVVKNEIINVEEEIEEYVVTNSYSKKNELLEMINDKRKIHKFLNVYLKSEEKILLKNIEKVNIPKDRTKFVLYKIHEKNIYILIKVIDRKDINLSYKIFNQSIKIIKEWKDKEFRENERYPIVIPIVIDLSIFGDYQKKQVQAEYRYIEYRKNRIDFSYNLLSSNEFISILNHAEINIYE